MFASFSVSCSTTAANEAKVTQNAGAVSTVICPKQMSSLCPEGRRGNSLGQLQKLLCDSFACLSVC